MPRPTKKPAVSITAEDAGDLIAILERRSGMMRAAELADFLGFSPTQVYRMSEQSSIPHVRLGGSIRYDPRAISRWLRSKATA